MVLLELHGERRKKALSSLLYARDEESPERVTKEAQGPFI